MQQVYASESLRRLLRQLRVCVEASLVDFGSTILQLGRQPAHQNADLLGKRGAKLRTLDFWGRAIVVGDTGGPARKRAGVAVRPEALKASCAAAALWTALAQPLAQLAPPRPSNACHATAAAAGRSSLAAGAQTPPAASAGPRETERELRDETLRPHRSQLQPRWRRTRCARSRSRN